VGGNVESHPLISNVGGKVESREGGTPTTD